MRFPRKAAFFWTIFLSARSRSKTQIESLMTLSLSFETSARIPRNHPCGNLLECLVHGALARHGTGRERWSGKGCNFLAYNWKLPVCSGASSLTVLFGFLLTARAFLLTIGAFYLQVSFLAYSGKVLLISSSTDWKPKSSNCK